MNDSPQWTDRHPNYHLRKAEHARVTMTHIFQLDAKKLALTDYESSKLTNATTLLFGSANWKENLDKFSHQSIEHELLDAEAQALVGRLYEAFQMRRKIIAAPTKDIRSKYQSEFATIDNRRNAADLYINHIVNSAQMNLETRGMQGEEAFRFLGRVIRHALDIFYDVTLTPIDQGYVSPARIPGEGYSRTEHMHESKNHWRNLAASLDSQSTTRNR